MTNEAEVFELFGRVAMKAQLFESSVGTLVIYMRTLVGENITTEEEVSQYVEDVDQRTLGALIGRLHKMSLTIDDEVQKVLAAGLDARNGLAHGFFVRADPEWCLDTDTGRTAMITDLKAKHETLAVADALVLERVEWLKQELRKTGLGVSQLIK